MLLFVCHPVNRWLFPSAEGHKPALPRGSSMQSQFYLSSPEYPLLGLVSVEGMESAHDNTVLLLKEAVTPKSIVCFPRAGNLWEWKVLMLIQFFLLKEAVTPKTNTTPPLTGGGSNSVAHFRSRSPRRFGRSRSRSPRRSRSRSPRSVSRSPRSVSCGNLTSQLA